MIDTPLYGNPLSGGAMTRPADNQLQGDALVEQMQMRMTQRDQKTPAFLAFFKDVMNTKGYPTKTMQNYQSQFPRTTSQQVSLLDAGSNANFNVSPPGTLKLDPQATMPDTLGPQLLNPLEDPFSNITAPGQIPDRYKEGFADFYKQNPDDYMRVGGQAISYVTTPQGETIRFGDTGGASNFRRYLESIGETPKPSYGDLSISTQFAPDNNTFPASPGFTPLPTIPKAIASPGLPPPEALSPDTIIDPLKTVQNPGDTLNPYDRVGQQLMGSNQNNNVLETLKNIEKGIASLSLNYGQGNNMNQSSNYGNFDNFGIGNFYPPYGGMYG